jgi:cobalt-precorrin-5B (C1)-methyltransferase
MGGLSILGTDGRVRPFSAERRIAAILLGVDVAVAAGVTAPVLVPGHLGRRSALKHLRCPEVQVIEIGNEVGAALKHCVASGLKQLLLYGHPGKLAKLAFGEFDTHSSRSGSAVDAVSRVAERNAIRIEGEFSTTEALFQSLPTSERVTLASAVARAVHEGIGRAFPELTTAVWLTDLEGNPLATAGELTLWLP